MDIPRDITLHSEDDSLTFKPPEIEDLDAIHEAVLISKPELSLWMNWCGPNYTIEVSRSWIERQPEDWENGSGYQFLIIDHHSRQYLGSCGLNHINSYFLLANLGYWVRSDRHGEGIATHATRTLAKFGFQQLGLRRIEIVTGLENWASRRVAEKTGAKYEGVLRKRLILGDKNIDAAMHSLIPEDLA